LRNQPHRIVIVGAGGHGSELASYIRDMQKCGGDVELIGFVDDDPSLKSFCGFEVIGRVDELLRLANRDPRPIGYITAFGSNTLRREIVNRIEELRGTNLVAWTLRHPNSWCGADVEVGEGTCLAPGSIVTSRARIGKHYILNVHASVSHDCVVGDYVNINPAATICGNVTIGAGAYIGAGATIKEKIDIGQNAVIGAGSVVIRDVPPDITVVGVPARIVTREQR